MDKLTLGFLALIIVLIISHFVRVEAFGDSSASTPGVVTLNTLLGQSHGDRDASGNSSGTINGLPAGSPGLPSAHGGAYDASGNDLFPTPAPAPAPATQAPSSYINLSISDLMALIGKTTAPAPATSPAPAAQQPPPIYIQQQTAPYEYGMNAWAAPSAYGAPLQNIMTSPSATQGADFLKYQYGINPADYIRKDSIPCYACTLPA
jgi:hypothetical protein